MACEVLMIARNEAYCIANAIASAHSVADRVVVLDTGSTDSTIECAEAAGAEVYAGKEWLPNRNPAPDHPFHFSEARNEVLAYGRADWVLSLDADEVVHCPDRGRFAACLDEWSAKGIRVVELSISLPTSLERYPLAVGRKSGLVWSRVPRLFRREGAHWQYRVHELVMPLTPLTQCEGDVCRLGHSERVCTRDTLLRNLALLDIQLGECRSYDDPGTASMKTLLDRGDTLTSLGRTLDAYGSYSAARDALVSETNTAMGLRAIIMLRLAGCAYELGIMRKTLEYATEALRILPLLRSAALLAAAASGKLGNPESQRQWVAYARGIVEPYRLEWYEGQEEDEERWIASLLNS